MADSLAIRLQTPTPEASSSGEQLNMFPLAATPWLTWPSWRLPRRGHQWPRCHPCSSQQDQIEAQSEASRSDVYRNWTNASLSDDLALRRYVVIPCTGFNVCATMRVEFPDGEEIHYLNGFVPSELWSLQVDPLSFGFPDCRVYLYKGREPYLK